MTIGKDQDIYCPWGLQEGKRCYCELRQFNQRSESSIGRLITALVGYWEWIFHGQAIDIEKRIKSLDHIDRYIVEAEAESEFGIQAMKCPHFVADKTARIFYGD